ncbi:MAG: 50S ribosomal protein L35 [Candidatus Reconcilbacillus cellulovorans]|uniref:Large ribosomal subunit protein bL35 n=1 Tax=Candidatus Reconcilbacillus cellulovorans TaxID=1906605 RepID=A0A2A6DZ17_9BACL|nr:MAG: 50S ribosomal protein L35 [Candidatus Reconcilbacillus cellulovorans]
MPKMKTKSSAKRRFKVTGSGKIRRTHAYRNHLMFGKRPSRRRRLREQPIIHPGDKKRIRRLLNL